MMLPDFRVRQRDYLLELAQALTQELDLEKLLGRVLNISIEMLAGHAGLITLRSRKGDWEVAATYGLPSAFLQLLKPYLSEVPSHPSRPEDYELPEINRLLKQLTLTTGLGLSTGVGLPLIARNMVVGVIFIFRNYPGVFSGNDRSLLSSFANQAAIAVQNAQFYSQIRQEKQRLNALLDSAADGILILSPDHHVEKCNPALARMLGIRAEDAIGESHETLIQWLNTPNGLTLQQAEAGGWPLTPHAHLYIEGDLKRVNSQPAIPVGITYAPLLTPEGTLLNIIATVRDITRFREAEEVKDTFISIISHELKTPVALIKGYASTLRREDASWDRAIVTDSLAVIEEEADRLGALIENLLDASRLQAGGMALKQSDVLLPNIVNRLSKRFSNQNPKHNFVVDFPPNFPVVLADETRLEQLLSNLLTNAIKYAPGGDIRISGQVQPDNVIICVSDQGPGIAPNDIPHIFDRFYRAPEMARNTKGAGLGLFLAKSIVEAHGGKIWVDPESGKGARICFSLPRQFEIED